jgi:hypothetical protein
MTTKPALQVAHNPPAGDGGHVFIGIVDAPATLEPQREGDRVSEVARIGGRELLVGVRHGGR